MTLHGISGNKGAQKTTQPKKSLGKDYDNKQQALKSQIIDPAKNLSDLKHNAKIKRQQITLAQSSGDMDTARILQEELNRIDKDITKNETSIFDDKNSEKSGN